MSLCALCASTGKTCCQRTDIVLTDGDLSRIRDHLGHPDFFEYRKPHDPTCLGDAGDPNWLAYTLRADGTRRVLRHAAQGDCLFLTSQGCALPADARPLICLLHPVTYTEAGITGVCPECPGELGEPGRGLLEAVGMELQVARRWHQQLYEELRREIRPANRAA